MKAKPKGDLHYRFAGRERCYITFNSHQIWDADKVKDGNVILNRDNVEIMIPYSDYVMNFKEMR